ncbi:MAG: hypothetical protein M0R28_21875 [Pigmentiphaga sp.]|nr:hypothetical protein [Pigmentiphaga sp.]
MKLLLDTHLLLWAAGDSARLSPVARRLILDTGNTLMFSVASLWEITIKPLGNHDQTGARSRGFSGRPALAAPWALGQPL